MSEIKEREIVVKIQERLPFAFRAFYAERLWGWVTFIDAIIPERGDQPEQRARVRRDVPPSFATPYQSLGEAVSWLVEEIETGRFDRQGSR